MSPVIVHAGPPAAARALAPRPLVEAFVTHADAARAAVAAGADRIELCGPGDGGLSPGAARLRAVRAAVRVPIMAMCRPREGDFVYGAADAARVRRAIDEARDGGADGIVIGAAHPDGTLDLARLADWIAAAGPLRVTVHRVFDGVPDRRRAFDDVAELGAHALLTSAGGVTAWAARDALRDLVRHGAARAAAGRAAPTIIAAGSVRAPHVVALVAHAGLHAVHAAADDPGVIPPLVSALDAARAPIRSAEDDASD